MASPRRLDRRRDTPANDQRRYQVEPWHVTETQLDPGDDPRECVVLPWPLISAEHLAYRDDKSMIVLAHRTQNGGMRLAAGMAHDVECTATTWMRAEASADVGRCTITAQVKPGGRLRMVKYIAYSWSSRHTHPALRAAVTGALAEARRAGWHGLLAGQRNYLDEYWAQADVEVDGDPEIQQALRFGLFHILQASARAQCRPIAAKGLTGTGYDGHTFWDIETFVLPALAHTRPTAARDALRWRHMALPTARQRAADLGLAGAAYPWRTINGEECSGYWPAGTAAFHVNADIADAALRYVEATGDLRFEREIGLGLLVETARLWGSLGHHDARGQFRIDGVTGPDEYSAAADDNVYTSLMAQRNLAAAARACASYADDAARLGVTGGELHAWRAAATAMMIPYDGELGIHPQHDGFTEHAPWDFAGTPAAKYPLLLHYPYFELYRKQVLAAMAGAWTAVTAGFGGMRCAPPA